MSAPIQEPLQKTVLPPPEEQTGCHALFDLTGDIWLPVRAVADSMSAQYLPAKFADCTLWEPVYRVHLERHLGALIPVCALPEVQRPPIPRPFNCRECQRDALRHVKCELCRSHWPPVEQVDYRPGMPRYGW